MPFADREIQRAYQREAARRRRAAKRQAAENASAHAGEVAPAVAPPAPPTAPPITERDLFLAGRAFGFLQGDRESVEEFRARLRAAWKSLLLVVSE